MALKADAYIVTINRDLLDSDGDGTTRPIRVENTRTGEVTDERQVGFPIGAILTYGPARQDGARCWIEAPYVQRYA